MNNNSINNKASAKADDQKKMTVKQMQEHMLNMQKRLEEMEAMRLQFANFTVREEEPINTVTVEEKPTLSMSVVPSGAIRERGRPPKARPPMYTLVDLLLQTPELWEAWGKRLERGCEIKVRGVAKTLYFSGDIEELMEQFTRIAG